jgi:methionine synthase I (cobalamin-dependent)
MTKKAFLECIAAGEVLVSDGAIGTDLQQQGLPVGAAAELWVLQNPHAIRALNLAFIQSGSDILLTCTFSATRRRLKATGLETHFEEINCTAVEITQDGEAIYAVTPSEMSVLVPSWVTAGTQVIGGCCGTSPEHLAAIARETHALDH